MQGRQPLKSRDRAGRRRNLEETHSGNSGISAANNRVGRDKKSLGAIRKLSKAFYTFIEYKQLPSEVSSRATERREISGA